MTKTGKTKSAHAGKTAAALRDVAAMRAGLLAWYDEHRRDLPWRRTSDPYAIWVSEIMLQQTRVAVVIERYREFLERFPTVAALAQADEQDVLALWSGLGYYRRARILHKAAQTVAVEMGGARPATAAALRGLAGIGAYTAAAIASIAHGEAVAVVDGNVERVLCRVAGWEADGMSALRKRVEALAAEFVHPGRPGDFNQAMMELGATVCTPRNPQCLMCPLVGECKTRGEHKTTRRAPMTSREAGHALVVRAGDDGDDELLLEQRSVEQTVMRGMWELPVLRDVTVPEAALRLTVRHAIMQVNYAVRIQDVEEADVDARTVAGGLRRWVRLDEAAGMALTGLARKVLTRAGLIAGKA